MDRVIPRVGDVIDTGKPDMDFIYEAIEKTNQANTRLVTQGEAAIVQQDSLTGVMEKAIKDSASAQTIIDSARLTADLEAQNATIASVEGAGTKQMQTDLLRVYTQQAAMAEELLTKKQDIMDDRPTGVGLIDAMVNGFRSVQVDGELRVARARQQQAATGIQNLAAATTQIATTNAATKKTLNEDVIRANLELIQSQASVQLGQVKLESLRSNAQMLGVMANANQQQMQNLLTAYKLEEDAETRALMQKEQDAKRKELESAEATDEQLVAAVRRGLATMNLPDEEAETILFKLRSSRDTATVQKYSKLLDIGANPDAPLGSTIGRTPYEARATMAVLDSNNVAEPTKGSRALEAVDARVAQEIAGSESLFNTEEKIQAKYNQVANDYMGQLQSAIRPGDSSNPYHAPPMDSIIAAGSRLITGQPLYQKVLKDAGVKETNAQELLQLAASGISAKSISSDEAVAGLLAVFTTATSYNNTIEGGFRRYGLRSQEGYKVELPRPGSKRASIFDAVQGVSKAAKGSGATAVTIGAVVAGDTVAGILPNLLTSSPTVVVDMTDPTAIRDYLIKLRSSGPAMPTTPQE